VRLVLPATSANLGPAFDAAAVALKLYLKISARLAPEYAITARGRDSVICSEVQNNLILNTYREVLESQEKPVRALALAIQNEIPIGKGCGSSAAARLAGIALANHFGSLGWSDSRIVGEASTREHHPDNAAACWLGGVAIARMSSDVEAQVITIQPKGKWPLLLVLPPEPLSTEEARRVLPAGYSRADTVTNVQNSMMLLAALVRGERKLLAAALQDRIHQPYRAPLCPLLPALEKMVGGKGLLGVALSGAGPSVLVFLDPKFPTNRIKKLIAEHLEREGLQAELLLTQIATRGAKGQA